MNRIISNSVAVLFITLLLLIGSWDSALAEDEVVSDPAEAPAADATAEETDTTVDESTNEGGEEAEGWDIYLFADESYRLRVSDLKDERDQDLKLFMDFGFSDPSDSFGGDVSFGFWADLDGDPDPDLPSSFASPMDELPPALLEVYKLSLEYRSEGILANARVGRQATEYGKDAIFDGLTFILEPWHHYLELYFLGGRTVHFFNLQTGYFEDWMAGAGMVIRPFQDLRLELGYRFSREEIVEDVGTDNTVEYANDMDHSVNFDLHYRYDDWFYLNAFLMTANEHLTEVGGNLRFDWVEKEFGVDLGAKAQPSTIGEITEAEDPYMTILGESLPFVNFHGDLWKSYTTAKGIYAFHLGYEGRQLTSDDETPFNRNFGRAYVLVSMNDIAVKGPFITLTFDRWADGPDLSEDGLWAVGGSAGYEVDVFRGEVGTQFDRFKYDYYLDVDEKTDVQTVFLDLSGKVLDWLRIKGRYEYERFDRDIHTVVIGLSQVY